MAYEIDFIGVSKEKSSSNADAICIQWQSGNTYYGTPIYKIGVIDCGYEVYTDAMINHVNKYYFDDKNGNKKKSDKVIDFVIATYSDEDHASGIPKILDNFTVNKIYMNIPWLYLDELFPYVYDGRITKYSLTCRLLDKYKYVLKIEDKAEELGVHVYEAFQGTCIEWLGTILNLTKEFYLDLLVESNKTLLEERMDGAFVRIIEFAKSVVSKMLDLWSSDVLRENVSTTAENEMSIVFRANVDGEGMLFTGDAEKRALTKAMDYLDNLGEDISSSISFYQIPHHGGRHNVTPSILDRMLGKK